MTFKPLTISPNDKKRLSLFRMTKNNPDSVPAVLKEIHKLAKDALDATLANAHPSLLRDVQKQLDSIFSKFETKSLEMHKVETKKFLQDIDSKLRIKISSIKPPKGDKGDEGLMPSDEAIRTAMRPLLEELKAGMTPTIETLRTLSGSVVAEMLTNMQPTLEEKAEAEKKLTDKITGEIRNELGDKISQIKRFGGGGATGANAQLISNITTDGTGDRKLTGAINGGNTSYSMPRAFKPNTERVFLNGVRMRKGASNDYTVTNNKTIVFAIAPETGDSIVVDIDAGV